MTSKSYAVDPIDVIRWVALVCCILWFVLDIVASNLENEAESENTEAQADDFSRGYRQGVRDATFINNGGHDAVPAEKD